MSGRRITAAPPSSLYKTVDGGKNWNLILSAGQYTGANEVHLDPRDPDVIYASLHQRFRNVAALMDGGPESGIHKSTDGGKTWRELSNGIPPQVKGKIGLSISPADPDYLMVGTDGGVYESFDGAQNWRFFANMPITQFYKVTVDYDEPFYNIYGGTQDNNTQGGPSRTDNVHGIRNGDWFVTVFADGHQSAASRSVKTAAPAGAQ